MKSILCSTLLALAVITFTPSYAAEIPEASVNSLIAQFEKAATDRDSEIVQDLISEDATMSGTVTMNGVKWTFQMNKAQFMESLKESWALADKYSYELKNFKVQISDGETTITSNLIEKIQIGKNVFTSNAIESTVVDLVNGKLQITKATADAEVIIE